MHQEHIDFAVAFISAQASHYRTPLAGWQRDAIAAILAAPTVETSKADDVVRVAVAGPVEENEIVQVADTPGPEGTEVQHVDDPDYEEPPIRFVWLFADQCDDEQKLQAVGTDAGDAKRLPRWAIKEDQLTDVQRRAYGDRLQEL